MTRSNTTAFLAVIAIAALPLSATAQDDSHLHDCDDYHWHTSPLGSEAGCSTEVVASSTGSCSASGQIPNGSILWSTEVTCREDGCIVQGSFKCSNTWHSYNMFCGLNQTIRANGQGASCDQAACKCEDGTLVGSSNC